MVGNPRRRLYWICQIVGWGLYAAFGLVFLLLFSPGLLHWRFDLVYALAAVIAVGCTHLYRGWLRRRGWPRLPLARAWWRLLAASVIVGVIIVTLVTALYPLLLPGTLSSASLNWIFPAAYTWILAVFVWNVIYFGVHYFDQYRAAQMEALRLAMAAKEAELRVLIGQLNPHFLFNCLNSVRALISEDPGRAQGMVTELSSLLRYTLGSGRRPTVTLAEEIDAVHAYLKLEAIRLEERLRVEWDVEPGALAATVPTLLVQTLVENAIKHGVAPQPGGGWIRIRARVAAGVLELEIGNSGRLAPGGDSTSIGLANARQRLRLLYGGDTQLLLAPDGPESVRALVRLPMPVAAPAGGAR